MTAEKGRPEQTMNRSLVNFKGSVQVMGVIFIYFSLPAPSLMFMQRECVLVPSKESLAFDLTPIANPSL